MEKGQRKDSDSNINLLDWASMHYKEEELQEVFLNMDKALQYLHNHNYCIAVFYPTHIEILHDQPEYIYFKDITEMPFDEAERASIIKQDIFRSALIQIGIYSNTLKYINPDFLKENFDNFAQFLPEDDRPYYRGVVQRGASIYLSEFAAEKGRRKLEELERELGDGASSEKGQARTLTSGHNIGISPVTNDKINDQIYGLNRKNEAAFVSNVLSIMLLLATIFLFVVLGLIFL